MTFATRRQEDPDLVRGRGTFVGDLVEPADLHAAFIRSPIAHGILHGLDTEDSEMMPGVIGVFTANDFELEPLPPPPGFDRDDVGRPLLARERVRYVGEPLAVVVTDSPSKSADAADLVWPEIEELPPVLTVQPEEGENEPQLFAGPNVVRHEVTEPRSVVTGELPVRATVEVLNQRIAPVAIEAASLRSRIDRNGPSICSSAFMVATLRTRWRPSGE